MKTNNFYKWLLPLLFTLLFIICIHVANDISFDANYLQGNSIGFILNDMVSLVASGYICYFYLCFWLKLNLKKKRGWLFEYGLLALFSYIFCLVVMYVSWNINGRMFTAKDVGIPGIVVGLFIFWVYTLLRNKEVQHKNDLQNIQIEKIKNDKLDTELKFLKAQYHPHFLFNALNTIYFQIDEANDAPRQTIEILSDLLRYQIYNDGEKIEAQTEVEFLKKYISLCKLRASERLELHTNFDDRLKQQLIYPLLFVPLIENAFKYLGGDYLMSIDMSVKDEKLRFCIENSITGQDELKESSVGKSDSSKLNKGMKKHGVGLENLKRRLDLLYHERYEMIIKHDGCSYKVELFIFL